MWRYESLAVLTPGITAGTGTFLDPAVYLNKLEEQGHETEAVAVLPTLNRLLIRHRPRPDAPDRIRADGPQSPTE
ncbi:MAG TPA: hypothetical protein VM282_19075 [Acidimicrobiales bacterium]|nr:hypothetical protein [Acidimicrobiales bacterium]